MSTFGFGYVLASAGHNGSTKESVENLVVGQEQIILALIAVIATAVAALVYTIRNNAMVKESVKEVSAVNAAVNNVGPGEHRLYDMISMIKDELKYLTDAQHELSSKGWATLPEDLASATAVTETIRALQRQDKFVLEKLTEINESLIVLHGGLERHVEWEMQQKYKESGEP